MTVCVATLFVWDYGGREKPSLSGTALIMSDRKITTDDVEYEPNQQKLAFITDRAVIAVAGDVSVHSEALRRTNEQVRRKSDTSPQTIAAIYGQAIQSIRQKQAEDMYLAPLGLNMDMFLSQQREYSDGFIDTIRSQMQNYIGPDVEALVVAGDGNHAHIIYVDSRGTASNMDDLGFAAIGIGSWHARSRLMRSGYVNSPWVCTSNNGDVSSETDGRKCARRRHLY